MKCEAGHNLAVPAAGLPRAADQAEHRLNELDAIRSLGDGLPAGRLAGFEHCIFPRTSVIVRMLITSAVKGS